MVRTDAVERRGQSAPLRRRRRFKICRYESTVLYPTLAPCLQGNFEIRNSKFEIPRIPYLDFRPPEVYLRVRRLLNCHQNIRAELDSNSSCGGVCFRHATVFEPSKFFETCSRLRRTNSSWPVRPAGAANPPAMEVI